ncbi:MAG: hypothetical protein OXC62_02070 [Aestuariivita sp.]|nr:hypothetical protein [Aestuariivita sp.]
MRLIDLSVRRWCGHFGIKVDVQQHCLAAYCQLADDGPRYLYCAQKA